MTRTILDLAKPKTTVFDLSNVLNPRVNDDLAKISFHIQYDDKPFNTTGYKMYFISADENMGYINIDGMIDKIEIGDNVGNGDVTFTFPPNVFKKAGTFDSTKTMFVIENINSNYIQSTINISLTVLENGVAKFNADVDQIGYDSKLEEIHNKYKDKAQNLIDELINQVQAVDNFNDVKETANQAKQVANDSIAKANEVNNEITTARSRFSNLNDRLNNQDIKINAAETTTNANANYNRLTEKDLSQDVILSSKADKIEIESRLNNQDEKISNKADKNEIERKLSQISLVPEAFDNVETLKSKYPNGKTGIFITVDTGHKWIYSNQAWVDTGVYQSVGISENSILPTYLTEQAKPIMLYPGNTPATYTTTTKTLNFGKGMIFRTYHHKLTKIPDNYELILDNQGYSNGYVYVDLTTGIPGYEPYLYNKMPDNSAIIGYVSWASQPYVDGKTEIMFGGQLGNYVVIDGRYHATSRDFLSNIYVTVGGGEGLIFDYKERTLTFPQNTTIFYGTNFHNIKKEVVAIPSDQLKESATIQRMKIIYNLKDDTAKVVQNFEDIPNYITLGYLDTNIGFYEPYTKIISNLPIKAINLPENLSFKFRSERKEKTYNILHYGYHNGVPHESKQAFLKSIEMGYDLDGDIVFTKDNIPILSHSNSTTTGLLERIRNLDGTEVTDVFDINNKTYDELCQYDWGIYMGEQYKGMKPLKLEDFFKLVRAYDCYAYLEFKTKLNNNNWELLRNLVNRYQVMDRIYWESFTDRFYNIKKLVWYMPNANISLITMDNMYQKDEFRSMLDQANTSTNVVTAMVASDMSVEKVKEIIDYGYQVDIWVANDKAVVEKYSSLPISGWATDGFDAKKVYQDIISQ